MSKRWFIPLPPIEHINGKIENTAVKCPNTYDSEKVYNNGFLYGYRHKTNINKSCFAVRHKSRDLNNKPYTDNELENRGLFTATLNAVNTHLQIVDDLALVTADFERQKYYTTIRGYAIAKVRANNGEWLREWDSSA